MSVGRVEGQFEVGTAEGHGTSLKATGAPVGAAVLPDLVG